MIKRKWNKRGAEDSFRNVLIGMIIVILFTFLILTVVVEEGSKYGKTNDVTVGALNYTQFSNTLNDINDTVSSQVAVFTEFNPFNPLSVAGVVVTGIFNVGKTFWTLMTVPYQLLMNIFVNVLGIPSIVIVTLMAIVSIIIIFSLWRVIRIGS